MILGLACIVVGILLVTAVPMAMYRHTWGRWLRIRRAPMALGLLLWGKREPKWERGGDRTSPQGDCMTNRRAQARSFQGWEDVRFRLQGVLLWTTSSPF